jgi:hypothetical protein
VFRFSTFVPVGGALYPWRYGEWVEGTRPPRVRISRTPQQGTLSPAMSDRSVCLPRHHGWETSRIFRGFSHALRCLTMSTAVARPGSDGFRPVQFRPICLWHRTGDTRSSFSVPFLSLFPRKGRHCSRRSKISKARRVLTMSYYPPAPSRRTDVLGKTLDEAIAF